ncbi:hypothetical protein M5K25_007619 [Dendrobium thyrsiflorum]|uniref:Reverse transcriptase zinc-binding domain-containing protein n=1 Tax=Dendrobium thyrsiflorum TaxID=117978 RepID=A0ABD0VM05_DENTH
MVVACGFLVIHCGGYDGGGYGEGSGLEVETIERKLLQLWVQEGMIFFRLIIVMDDLSCSLHSPSPSPLFKGLNFNGLCLNHLICADDLLTVYSYISNDHWILPDSFMEYVKADVLNVPINEQPSLAWDGSYNYSFRNFTAQFFSGLEVVNWYKFLWHKNHSLRFSSYAWMALIKKLKTTNLLIRLLKIIGICVLNPLLDSFLLRLNLHQTLEFSNSTQQFNSREKNLCFLTICCAIYYLWRKE